MATITTGGYGYAVPISAAGRAVGFALMLGGMAFFRGLTANPSSFLVSGVDARYKAVL